MARHVIAAALAPLFAAACSDYEVTEHTFTERFEQPAISSSADVLFVIDDSASMSEEQVKLASNFQSFVDVLEGTYADYQIGVVTTDVSADDAGALRGGIMTPDTPDLADALLAALDVGDDGDVDERGFDAARLALFSGLNPGFVRGDARLNVVFFSDDDDHSDDEIVNYVHEYDTLAGGGGGAAHAIAGAVFLADDSTRNWSAASSGSCARTAASMGWPVTTRMLSAGISPTSRSTVAWTRLRSPSRTRHCFGNVGVLRGQNLDPDPPASTTAQVMSNLLVAFV